MKKNKNEKSTLCIIAKGVFIEKFSNFLCDNETIVGEGLAPPENAFVNSVKKFFKIIKNLFTKLEKYGIICLSHKPLVIIFIQGVLMPFLNHIEFGKNANSTVV